MKSKILLLTILLLFTANFLFAGGGWPQKKGKGYYKIGQWWVVADMHFTSSGGIDPNGTRGTYVTSLYFEYGITDRLTGILYFPFFTRATVFEQVSAITGNIIVPGDDVNSIGDTDISFKYGLIHNKPIVLSATLTFGLPLGKDDGGFDGSIQTGDGEYNQMLTIDVSKSFNFTQSLGILEKELHFKIDPKTYSTAWYLEHIHLLNKTR